jgi:hypothetical protein
MYWSHSRLGDCMLILPPRKPGTTVAKEKDGRYQCPFCGTSHTLESPDSEWVELLLPNSKSITICVGCCIDIFNTCRVADFHSHPYFDVVKQAAIVVRIPVDVFREHCLDLQLALMKQTPEKFVGRMNEDVKTRIEQTLKKCRTKR